MTKHKCPHGKRIPLLTLQVAKLGAWDGRGPYALFVDLFGGGGLQIAEGTRCRMYQIQRHVLDRLRDDWSAAKHVADLTREIIPAIDRPAPHPRTPSPPQDITEAEIS
jgi:hypothetical protein